MNYGLSNRTPIVRSGILGLAVVVALGGCASTPRQDANLEESRAAVAAAHADPTVKGDANVEMVKADAALMSADTALSNGSALVEVDHQAYLADRYARAARMHGALLSSQAEIAQQDNRRNAVLLQARNADVRTANANAEASRMAATDANAQAAASAADLADANVRAAGLASDLASLQAKQTDRGVVITLGDVLFASGKSELQGNADRSLDALASFLQSHPERLVRIEGFTDSVGSESLNQGLSERRAASVAAALTRRGIDSARLRSQGYGESYPVGNNGTPTGRQDNRRVEVVISNADSFAMGRSR